MKQIALTMRVDEHGGVNERRDAIDQRWYDFLSACNATPILIPNSLSFIKNMCFEKVSGIILTGGNSLQTLGGSAPERDNVETQLIDIAVERKLPLLGICRGMQVIQQYFGIDLYKVVGHVKIRHDLVYAGTSINVNSFHEWGTTETIDDLDVLARSDGNIIEAISHKTLPISAIMWHPEREETFSSVDITLFQEHFSL
ncbi:MAG TPA: gamma-glutamyl-gamma-aminobutyrate hydrolase [Holosporales bacterium]|nr:gamma-glutamyl-gamma-aminobutyrate hydrolase [Holosporales bacterium]